MSNAMRAGLLRSMPNSSTGFTPMALTAALDQAGFTRVFVAAWAEAFEVRALAFKSEPTVTQCRLLGL